MPRRRHSCATTTFERSGRRASLGFVWRVSPPAHRTRLQAPRLPPRPAREHSYRPPPLASARRQQSRALARRAGPARAGEARVGPEARRGRGHTSLPAARIAEHGAPTRRAPRAES
eukprot:scaffold38505_cov35-Tisochrysis_lutea.AAC.2